MDNNPTQEHFPYTYSGFENAATAQHLRDGETCKVTGIGNSMTPILQSRQPVICIPVTEETELKKRDIVLCKVNGHYYLHLIWSAKKVIIAVDDYYTQKYFKSFKFQQEFR